MPKHKRKNANGKTICKGEQMLMSDLKRLGQLEPDARLQELLIWGKSQGLSKRQEVRHLSKEIRRGNIDVKQFGAVQKREAHGKGIMATGGGNRDANELNQPMESTEHAVLAHLQHTGRLEPDAVVQDLLQWGRSLGITTRDDLRTVGRNLLPATYNQQRLDAAQTPDPTVIDCSQMTSSERALLGYLQHTGQLSPAADLQDLVEWGKQNDHSTRDSLQSLGEAIGNGSSDRKPLAPRKNHSQVPPSLIQHKLEPKKIVQPCEAPYRDDCTEKNAGAMNWATMAAHMVPSDLAILTHLQLIGQLPVDADLHSLLQLGRECGFTHETLHEAGNDIRFGPPSASQEAYRERLQYLASYGVDCMRAVLDNEAPGVGGRRTAAIEAINHFDLGVEDPAPRFWRQTSTHGEDLGDHSHPSIFSRSRLYNTDMNFMETAAEPMPHPEFPSSGNVQDTNEPIADEDAPEYLESRSATPALDRSTLEAAPNRGSVNGTVADHAQDAYPEDVQVLSHVEAKSITGSKIIERRGNSSFRVKLLHDFDTMQADRTGPARTAESGHPSLKALFGGCDRDSVCIDAETLNTLSHSLGLEKEEVQGDLFFVDYDGDLDLPGRVQISNGTLLDDMDIEGV